MFLKGTAKKRQHNRKTGEKWENHKHKLLFTLFEKGTLSGNVILAPKNGLDKVGSELCCSSFNEQLVHTVGLQLVYKDYSNLIKIC